MQHFYTGLKFWLFFVITICGLTTYAQVASESDLKKEGDKYFDARDFEKALPDYSRLLSLYPNNSEYAYRFGVCQIMAGKDKTDAFSYLEKVSQDEKAPAEVWFYLGKSYLVINEFSKAKDAFNKFIEVGGEAKAKKYEVDTYISNSENAAILVKSRKNVIIMNSKEVPKNNFYSSYDFNNAPGKIVNASEEFYSQLDRTKQKDAVMFMTNDKQTILISSYGVKGENGKDIYIIRRLADGTWSKAQNLGVINSPKDEEYPFLDRDGKTLYFSSCGHNSMGGYDIFKSVFDFNTSQWSNPENMGVPINSVYDDLLFIPQDNKNAIYATDIESAIHQISIRTVEIPSGLSEMLTISGEYKPRDQQIRRDARITALTSDGTGIISSVHTDPVTGKYDLILAPGQTYMLVVEGGGYAPHMESFELPAGLNEPVLKQVVHLDKDNQKEEMTLENYFSSGKVATEPTAVYRHSYEANADTSNMISITINNEVVRVPAPPAKDDSKDADKGIADEEYGDKSTDTVNKGEADSTSVESPDTSAASGSESGDTVNTDDIKEEPDTLQINYDAPANESELTDNTTSFSKDITNEELAKIAFEDAKALQVETDSLKSESASLKKSADDLEMLADQLSAAADSDSTISNQVSTMRMQADQFRGQANSLDKVIADREQETIEALANANAILKASGGSKNSKSKSAKSAKTNETSLSKDQLASNTRPETKTESTNTQVEKIDAINVTALNVSANENKSETVNPDTQQSNNEIKENVVPAAYKELMPAPSANEFLAALDKGDGVVNQQNSVSETQANSHTNSETSPEAKTEYANNTNSNTGTGKPENISTASKNSLNDQVVTENIPDNNPAGTDPLSGGSLEKVFKAEDNNTVKSETGNPPVIEANAQQFADAIKADSTNKNESGTVSQQNSPENVQTPAAPVAVEVNPTSTVSQEISANKPVVTPVAAENTVTQSEPASTPVNKPAETKNDVAANQTLEEIFTETKTEPVAENSSVKTDDTISKSDSTEKNSSQLPGESPRPVTAQTVDPNSFPGYSELKINEEAKTAYRQAQSKLEESNVLSNQSLSMQKEISQMKSSPERDSKIKESNEVTQHSMEAWQEGLKLIEESRRLEPNIDYKMGVFDFANKNGSGDDLQGTENSGPLVMKGEMPRPVEVQSKNEENTAKQNIAESAKAKEDTSFDHLDTSHPDYPVYVKLQKDITDKQVETIDVFAEAINLSRMASDERDQAYKLLDAAQTEKDAERKEHMLKSADELQTLASTHEAEAKKKYEMAKGRTNDVKSLVAQMKEVKERITVKPEENLASANKNVGIIPKGSGKKLSEGGGLTVVEEKANKKMDAQSFAMTERANSGMNATDEEILAVNVTNEQRSNFLNTCYNRTDGAAYSESNPVPIDPSLPEGLIFKIQIGAFRNPLPASTFKNISPLSGETTRPGWIRYCVGMFRTFEPANTVKNDIKKTGYKDAFVVAYYNGKRIDLNDAYTIIRNKEDVTAYRSESAKEMAILRNMNIKPITVQRDQDLLAFYAKQPIKETLRENDEETIKAMSEVDNGSTVDPMKYTVQLGIFNTASTPQALASMSPAPPSKVKSNSYRYTTYTFDNKKSADSVKNVAIQSGIKDAFVVGVKNGKYVSVNNASLTEDYKQKWNDVVKEEIPTAEPVYKVQIGAFRNDVPYNIIESYLAISDKGITRKTDERGLHIFYVGSFKEINQAAALKLEVVSKGIKDAFVVVLKDGKRVAIPQN